MGGGENEPVVEVLSQTSFGQGDAHAERGDAFGHAVATGDFNGDGLSDLAVGAPQEQIGRGRGAEYAAGAVSIAMADGGQPGGLIDSRTGAAFFGTDFDLRDAQSEPRSVSGALFGQALAVGRFDGDDLDDVAVLVPGRRAVAIFYGAREGGRLVGGRVFVDDRWPELVQDAPADAAAWSLVEVSMAAGQLDDDAQDELIVGVTGHGVFVYGLGDHDVGSLEGRSVVPRPSILGDEVGPAELEASAFGRSVAVVGARCRGFLVVGAPTGVCEDSEQELVRGGRVHVVEHDGAMWHMRAELQQLATEDGCEDGDRFGYALAPTPDGGILVTAPAENGLEGAELRVHRFSMDPDCGRPEPAAVPLYVTEGVEDEAGRVGGDVTAGDYDGDGRLDVVAGRPYRDLFGHRAAGDVAVFLGQDADRGDRRHGQQASGSFDKQVRRLVIPDNGGRLVDDPPGEDDRLGLCLD